MNVTRKKTRTVVAIALAASLVVGVMWRPDDWVSSVCSGLGHLSELVRLPWKQMSDAEDWPARFNPTWRECY